MIYHKKGVLLAWLGSLIFYGKVYNDDCHVFSDFYYRTTSISSVSSDGDSGILVSFGCYHYFQSTIWKLLIKKRKCCFNYFCKNVNIF